MVAERVTADRRRRGHRRPRPRRRRPRRPAPPATSVIHSAATVVVRLAARLRRRGEPPRPAAASSPRCRSWAWPPTSSPVSTCYVRRQPPGRGARAARAREPVLRRRRLAGRGRGPPAGPARDAEADEPSTPSCPGPVPQGGPRRAGGRRHPGAGGQDRAAPRRLGARSGWWRPAGPAPPRSAGPTPTPTPRPSASGRCPEPRRGARSSIVRPSIIESALPEPRPGWIRGFRMAEPVIISYARGLLKEFPACPRARST